MTYSPFSILVGAKLPESRDCALPEFLKIVSKTITICQTIKKICEEIWIMGLKAITRLILEEQFSNKAGTQKITVFSQLTLIQPTIVVVRAELY